MATSLYRSRSNCRQNVIRFPMTVGIVIIVINDVSHHRYGNSHHYYHHFHFNPNTVSFSTQYGRTWWKKNHNIWMTNNWWDIITNRNSNYWWWSMLRCHQPSMTRTMTPSIIVTFSNPPFSLGGELNNVTPVSHLEIKMQFFKIYFT